MTQGEMKRRPDETELQYIWRLCSAKDAGVIDLTWFELADILNKELIDDESEYLGESAYRKKYQQAKAFYEDVFSKMESDEYSSEIAERRRELQKEKYKFYDERNAYNKMLRERSRQEELNEIIERTVSSGSLPYLSYTYHERFSSDNDLIVSLNDIHYGANIDNHWNQYNSDICRAMLCKYVDQIIDIAKTHNSERCIITCGGDLINGNIHYSIAVTNRENVIQQIMGISELISQFAVALSEHFSQVQIVSVAGNHSRIDVKDRALKDERLDDLVEWYIAARLREYDNIVVGGAEKVDTTMYLIDVRGKTYCGVHGDYDGSEAKIQALQTMARRPIYAVLSGHLHHCKVDEVQGIKTVMAGSFIGMDDYCISKRIYGEPEQMVCVCDNNGIRCSYFIKL